MKGLMVTLLVVFGSGSSLAQQFSGNDFSADRTNRTANQNSSLRTNQTRLQPLKRSFDRTSMRVAQSSSTNDGGFRPTSSQTIGGTDYEEGSHKSDVVPVTNSDRDQDNGLYNFQMNRGGQQQSVTSRQNYSNLDSERAFPSNQASSSNNQLRAWPLPVSPEWERTLKTEGYIYAPIKPQEQNSIGEVVMFRDNSQFGNRSGTGSNVTSSQWEVYKNTAIIDVDNFSLQEIQKRTLTLRNLGVENLTGVALRYVGDNGNKIDVRRIGNIPGNNISGNPSETPVANRNDFGHNQPNANRVTNRDRDRGTNRNTRPNERQFSASGQRDVSFSDSNRHQDDRQNFDSPARNTFDNGGWNVNDNQRIRQPRQPFQSDSRDRFADDNWDRFGDDNRDFSRNNNRLSNDYLDSLQRRDADDRDQRDIDYVRDRINQNRSDEYSLRGDDRISRYPTDNRFDDDRRSRSNRTPGDGRSLDYDANFASQQRELQKRLLDAKRLEVKNAEDAAWLKHQRESMEEARLARFYDEDLTPLPRRSSTSDNYSPSPYRFGANRLADRSTDPNYSGRRTDALSATTASNASADRVAQILAEKEADLDAKIGAIDHLMKLDSAGRNLDSKINSLKNVNQPNNSRGRVHSLVSQTVPNTLGGDLAASRHVQVASVGNSKSYNGLNGGAPPLDINGYRQRNRGDSTSFSEQPASDKRMLRLMWLLLLISLGANFYLAMLSRSFYTQYEELADELRETFSNSSSMSSPRPSSRPSPRTSARSTPRSSTI